MPVPTNRVEIKKSSLAPISVIFFGGNYLGSKLAEKLLEKDSRVIIVDKFDADKEFHFINLRDNPKLLMVNADLDKGIPTELNTVDYVYFLNYFDYFAKSNKVKIIETAQYTKNIINFCVKADAKFTFVSNIEVKNEYLRRLFDNQRLIQEIIRESEEARNLNFREVSLPIIYGPRMILENSGSLIKILDDYLNGTEISLDDENRNKDYFVFIEDAVNAVIKAMFSDNSRDKVITVSEKDGYSEMEIGSIIKSLATRHLNISYIENKNKLIWQLPEEKNLHLIGYAPKINLRSGIILTLNYYGQETNTFSFKPDKLIEENKSDPYTFLKKKGESTDAVENVNEKTQASANITYQKYRRNSGSSKRVNSKGDLSYLVPTILLTFLMVFVIFPIGTIYYNYNNAKNNISELKVKLGEGNLPRVRELAEKTSEDIDSTLNNFKKFKTLFVAVKGEEDFKNYENILLSLKSFTTGINSFTYGVQPYVELTKSLKEGKEMDQSLFKSSSESLEMSYEYFNKANEIMESTGEVSFGNSEIEKYKEALPKIVKLNKILLATSRDAGDLFGFEKPNRILFLFQNPAEIRPTGGFIGSYGVMEISKGKVLSLSIDDIYNPDGQVDVKKVRVTPPASIRNFLKEDKLYIRNANYNSDFPSSAENIADLFNKTTSDRFDNIIAIDYTFIQSYLDLFGGIYLNNYQEEINASNFTERAQFHSEFNYKEGISEKKSFLTTLGSKIIEGFFQLNTSDLMRFNDSIYGLLETRNIQIYTKYPNLAKSLNELKWDGALVKTNGDYLKIVNSNLGGNKVNYLTKNKYKYEVLSMTRDGVLRGRVTLSYTNNAKDKAWPYGNFTNYVKVLTQKGAKLTGARIIDSENKETNIFNEVIISGEGAYQSFETPIIIEPQTTKLLVIEYDLPQNLTIVKGKNTKYNFYWQKQSGENNEIEFSFSQPYGFDLGSIESKIPLTSTAEKVSFSESHVKDAEISVNLR